MTVKVRALSLPPARFKTMSDSVSNTLEAPAIPRELMVELQERAERAAKGIIDPDARRIARERMDRMREEFRLRHGEVNLAVELIREARDSA
jgi:hypothetical protein